MRKVLLTILLLLLLGCTTMEDVKMVDNYETATLAGGCFWCIEAFFQETDGVIEAVSGYTGGDKANPSYEEVSSGTTGHYESVQIKFDPDRISYKQLLELFWRQIDPLDTQGQFSDKGSQYRTAIFYHNEEQKNIAEESKAEQQKKFEQPIVTQILPVKEFYPAEDYHQDYYKKRSLSYNLYKEGSGRKQRLKEVWE